MDSLQNPQTVISRQESLAKILEAINDLKEDIKEHKRRVKNE